MTISLLDAAWAERAYTLIKREFLASVAPHYSLAGINAFFEYITPPNVLSYILTGAMDFFGMCDGEALRGVIGLRPGDNAGERHIVVLFIDGGHQRDGIGRALVSHAAALSGCGKLTVNAAPNAVGAYDRMGFTATDTEREQDGIRYLPMVRDRTVDYTDGSDE